LDGDSLLPPTLSREQEEQVQAVWQKIKREK
jgi:hypothetical protein